MKKFNFITIIILFLSFDLFATETKKCETSLNCKLGEKDFFIHFESPTHSCEEDDMDLVFEVNSVKSKLGVKKGWLDSLSDVGNGKSICKVVGQKSYENSPVFSVGKDQILIFYWENGRPGFNWVSLALVDIKQGKLLDFKQRLGELKEDTSAILTTSKGFKIRLVKEYLKEVKCDCSAAAIDEWLEISVKNGKIKTRWP
ncbi:MAG: hypothetical protein K2Q18_17070 [Bdellovibrionales bacterium]|nr:hypothetical protein [Bdellovibrionales bacterium]